MQKYKTLTTASHKLAEAMYKKEQGGCEDGSCNPNDKKKKKDDDVIDAEVE
jgi:molecular chaperone DnaK